MPRLGSQSSQSEDFSLFGLAASEDTDCESVLSQRNEDSFKSSCYCDGALTWFALPLIGLCFLGFWFIGTGALALAQAGENPNVKIPNVVGSMLGGVLLSVTSALLARRFGGEARGIEVTQKGIEKVTKRGSQMVFWDEIERIVIESRQLPDEKYVTKYVTVFPKRGKKIQFDTSYTGDPDIVLANLSLHVDYIVQNPSEYRKNLK